MTVTDVNDLVNRFFEARKMMKQMAGQFGFGGGGRAPRKQAEGAQGQEGQEGPRGPAAGALPGRRGMPDLSGLPPSLQRAAARAVRMDQLPPGFDPQQAEVPEEAVSE